MVVRDAINLLMLMRKSMHYLKTISRCDNVIVEEEERRKGGSGSVARRMLRRRWGEDWRSGRWGEGVWGWWGVGGGCNPDWDYTHWVTQMLLLCSKASKASTAVWISMFHLEVMRILSLMSLLKKGLNQPVAWTNLSTGRTTTGLLRRNNDHSSKFDGLQKCHPRA